VKRKKERLLKQTLEGIYDGDAGRHGERVCICGQKGGDQTKEKKAKRESMRGTL
jgi:hypothetical protein